MDGKEIIFVLMLLVGFVLGLYICSIGGEGIDDNVLDNVCKELTNNSEAYFVQNIWIQYEFPCRIDNKILIYGKEIK